MSEILKADNITKRFNQYDTALKGITLSLDAGSFTVLLGQSGSGKSTLINIMSCLLKSTGGSIYYEGTDIMKMSKKQQLRLRREKFGNIFQDYLLLAELTVKENIQLGKSESGSDIPYDDLLHQLDIKELENRFPHELSGGQRQRAAIARAVIKKPDILFCDEATGALDEQNSKNVVNLLSEINRKYKTTVVFSTHNIQISKTADRIITMKDGRVADDRENSNPQSVLNMKWGLED